MTSFLCRAAEQTAQYTVTLGHNEALKSKSGSTEGSVFYHARGGIVVQARNSQAVISDGFNLSQTGVSYKTPFVKRATNGAMCGGLCARVPGSVTFNIIIYQYDRLMLLFALVRV